jgi:hypothetical protein
MHGALRIQDLEPPMATIGIPVSLRYWKVMVNPNEPGTLW